MGDLLTSTELYVATAVHRLNGTGYGVSIRRTVAEDGGRKMMIGTVYAVLDRLEKRGWVESCWGEATAERGGKRKRLFRLTAEGLRVLSLNLSGLWRLSGGHALAEGFVQ